jgi:hypothetical protein
MHWPQRNIINATQRRLACAKGNIIAITAVAAIAGAGAVAEGIVAVETLATIATVTSVVGAITGSKALMSLGAGMGLGAIGANLAGLGEAATESSVATTATDAAQNAGTTAADSATNAAGAAGDSGAVTGAVADPAAGITQTPLDGSAAVNAGASPAAAETAEPIGDGGASAATSSAPAADTGATQATPDVSAPSSPDAPAGPSAPSSPADQIQNPGDFTRYDRANYPVNNGGFQSSGGFFGDTIGKVSSWMDKNKTLASGLMNLGGGALQGASKMYEADRQYDINQSLLQLKQQQAANAKAQPTIGVTVNPNANVLNNPQQTYSGIIAGARGK